MSDLFEPLQIGAIRARNRVVMAPLTRDRAGPGQVPTAMMATYYGQRASAGLIISEATQIAPEAQGYLDTPGMHSAAQVAGWRGVTEAVHAHGGRIVAQLWHVGRISHVSLQPGGQAPVSSTSRAAASKTFTAKGFEDVSTPRALRTDELPGVVAAYRQAARHALDAGFDGVEVHGANGYLLDQFLRDSVNDRTDAYGGSRDNRMRLLLEVMRAVCAEVGAERCGLRLSPVTPSNGAAPDSDPQGLFEAVMAQLAPLRLAYVHVIEGATGGARDVAPFDYGALRRLYKQDHPQGVWLVNNGYSRQTADAVLARGEADAVAFGRPFISNPDLVRRLRDNLPLAALDRDTLYGGGERGYIDYPALPEA